MEQIGNLKELKQMNQELASVCNIPMCPKCGEATGIKKNLVGKQWIMPRMCKCRREELKKMEKEQQAQEKQIRLQRMFNNSLMTNEFKKMTFENWDHKLGNKKMYDVGIKYIKDFAKMQKRNIGLLIHGVPGNGKTYLSGCIANGLLLKHVPVVCVSAIGILDRIKESFASYGDEGVSNILNCLDNADLVIIDDLGTENNTSWSRATMYQIIDSRYRKQKPLIVTSNLRIDQLKKRYDVDAEGTIGRTFDRLINEMCTPIENVWPSIRIKKGREKSKMLGEILNAV